MRCPNVRICIVLWLLLFVQGCPPPATKDQIIAAANLAAEARGVNLSDCTVLYDEGNVESRQMLGNLHISGGPMGNQMQKLKKSDFQAVIYKPKKRHQRGSCTVYVDRKTGKVIGVMTVK